MIGLDRTWNMFLSYKIRTEKHECIGGSRDITTRQTLSRWCTATPGCNWHRLRWREKGWRRWQRLNRIVTIFWFDKRPWSYIGRKHDRFLGRARETNAIHSRFGWVQAYLVVESELRKGQSEAYQWALRRNVFYNWPHEQKNGKWAWWLKSLQSGRDWYLYLGEILILVEDPCHCFRCSSDPTSVINTSPQA